ncbi:MAG TPA: hypothetical protein EYG86_00175 [Crocinitomicaceae bacterium]|nr:hypothetical protein [Crocinitomicaceae bacterium]
MITQLLFLETAPVGVFDILLGILFLAAILFIASAKKVKMLAIPGNEHYKYYIYNVYFKIFFAIIYGAIYKYYYHGGDTMAYWNGAANLNNLFWESPVDYWNELMMTPSKDTVIMHFTSETGYPPGWIYNDSNSFFVSKILSLFMVFLGQSYLMLSIFLGWLMAKASWKIYELVLYYKITSEWLGALSVLFIPSAAFWCSGISKDTIVLLAVFNIIHHIFSLANKTVNYKMWAISITFLSFFVLLQTRSFMAFTVAGPLFLALSTRIVKKYQGSPLLANIVKLFILSLSVLAFVFILKIQGEEIAKMTGKYINEAKVQQKDFQQNASYGIKKYDLGITDFTPIGMIKTAPLAILTAFYRPGIWEARSPLLLISGLETTIFIFLTLYFLFKGKILDKFKFISNNELLMFSIAFAIILGFFAGFTSILFGVLVRIKAPLLPFLLIVLTVKATNKTKTLINDVE